MVLTSREIRCTLELLKEYRKLDGTVTMRINRTNAQFRDRDRLGATGKGNVQEQACAYLWQELVGARRNINPIITLEALITFSFLRPLFFISGQKPTGSAGLK
jgi:hypothetical protein